MWRTVRDALIVISALCLGAYEIIWGGGRLGVLSFLASLILSPVVMRVDDIRDKLGRKRDDTKSDQ